MISFRGKGIAALIVANALIFGLAYFSFDSAIKGIAVETIDNWYRAEQTDIIEGNLLSAVAKNQKLLLSSEFLKGGLVFRKILPREKLC